MMNQFYKAFREGGMNPLGRLAGVKKSIFTLAVMLFTSLSMTVMAQDVTVSGTVKGTDGTGLPGVTVQAKGTTKGTQTNIDGTYKLAGVQKNGTLVFSFVGMETKEVAIGNKSVVDVILSDDSKALEEVVVVGYGTVKKKDATGAVSAIGAKDFNQGIVTSPEQLLQGRVAGVAITQNNGEPGGAINIRIRGTTSVNSGTQPLFVIDGVPLTDDGSTAGQNGSGLGSSAARNPLNFLNPDDIASIDILKDASATAIYGSRGANGVVLVTTKKGKGGSKGGLEYSVSTGFSSITKRFDLLTAAAFKAAGGLDQKGSTDWQDQAFRTGITQQHNLAYGGGDATGNYRVSFGYLDQQGIIQNSSIKRYSGSFNGNKKFINNKLTIGVNLTVANTLDGGVPVTDDSGFSGDLLAGVLKSNPTMAVYKADGKTFNQPGISEPNPVAILNLSRDNTNTLRALGNINLEYEIVKGLKFKTLLGFDKSISARKIAFSRDLVVQNTDKVGRAYFTDIELNNSTWENYFSYDHMFGKTSINATLGYSYQKFDYFNKSAEATNFLTSNLDQMINNVAAADNSKGFGSLLTNSNQRTDELQSYFGRVNAGFGKLLATATLRIDGSTRFGGNNKYGYFPSLGLAYKLIEEDFIPKNVFSDLKLRVGYGITGNQTIPHNLYQQRQRYSDWNINADATSIGGGGLNSVSFPNPNLKWESTTQYNVGVDFALAGNKISGTIDYYRKDTKDLLIKVTSAQPASTPFVWTNLPADLYNTGIELGLNIQAVDKKNFTWEVLVNGGYNTTLLDNFNAVINTGAINGQGLTGAFAQRIASGQPLYSWFLREFGGYDDQGNTIYTGGDVQRFLGKGALPTTTAGLTNNFHFGNLDVSIFFNGSFGNYIYSNNANAFWTKGAFANGRNVTTDVPGLKEGPLNAPDVSSRFLYSGDFVRLQNASIGYRVKTGSNSVISGLRFYVTGQNLLLFTSYPGQDPEVNTSHSINGFSSYGIDYTAYPKARTITIGANISF